MAHHLDSIGVVVYAGCLDADSKGAQSLKQNCSENIHVLQMDVRKADQIKAAVAYIDEHQPLYGNIMQPWIDWYTSDWLKILFKTWYT